MTGLTWSITSSNTISLNETSYTGTLCELFPASDETLDCMVCAEVNEIYHADLLLIIIHLNDDHQWTREAIADWLETLSIDIRMKDE